MLSGLSLELPLRAALRWLSIARSTFMANQYSQGSGQNFDPQYEGRLDPNGGTGTQNPMNQKQKRQQAGDEEQNRAARQHPGHGNISEGQARGFSKCSTPSRAQPFYNPDGMMRNDKVGLGRLASARRIP